MPLIWGWMVLTTPEVDLKTDPLDFDITRKKFQKRVEESHRILQGLFRPHKSFTKWI